MDQENASSWKSDADRLRKVAPKHILFLCVANSARSQMAEGIARSIAPGGVRVSSAGSAPSRVNPLASLVLQEIGIDISSHHSKDVGSIDSTQVDAIVTLCAEEECPVFPGNAVRIHWPLPDPALRGVVDAEAIERFRSVRDELRKRLKYLFQNRG